MAKQQNIKEIISLGFYCGISIELMKCGFRSASYPFDWVISSFEGLLDAISNNFKNLICKEFLYQNTENPNYFLNSLYKIEFYHDFTKHKALSKQLFKVRKKYKRRIKRFYRSIEKPCLFIRYIQNENELLKIPFLLDKIYKSPLLKNQKSEIIFFCNDDLLKEKKTYKKITIIPVKKDHNDELCRNPIVKSGLKEELIVRYGRVDKTSIEKFKKLGQIKKQSIIQIIKKRFFKEKNLFYSKKYYIKNGKYCLLDSNNNATDCDDVLNS